MYKKCEKFLKDVIHEARLVTWPSKDETLKTMLVVLCFSIFFMLFFMLTDFFCYKIVNSFIYF